MNIDKIKEIVNSVGDKEQKSSAIIKALSEDSNVLFTLITLLATERNINKQMVSDLNLEVSRYHIHINNKDLLKKNLQFLNTETKSLYTKWKDYIRPPFNNKL